MEQQVALVTGAARGIGLEVSAQLSALGYEVVLGARDFDAADSAARLVDGRPVMLDVTSRDQVMSAVEGLGGRLDVLVNNAAAFAVWEETVLTADLDAIEKIWQTNVVGPWRILQAAAPLLERSANPRVVNVGSGSGSHGDATFGLAAGPAMASYAITKAALGALTRKAAAAMPYARVNAVDPGLTATAPGMEAMGARPVAEGAASVVWAATLPTDGPTGGFFRDGRPHPW